MDEPMPNLSPVQQEIADLGLLDHGSALLRLPTGSGKTFLSRIALAKALASGRRGAFLCPLKALARELAHDWAADPLLSSRGVAVFTGELGLDEEKTQASPRDVALGIYTAEKFDSYLRAWKSNLDWLSELELLVVDEFHILGEGRRGATLEGILTRIRAINPALRTLCLSATLGNPEELGRWLGARVHATDARPIPLSWRIATFKPGPGAKSAKASLSIAESIATGIEGGQSLVFCQSRARTEALANTLSKANLAVAAHHAGKPHKERERIEAAFKAGRLDVLVATPTLAMGVNLPARKVVLHDLQRYEEGDWEDLSVNEVWQLAGRAGRRGLDSAGEVVLIAPQDDLKAARRYIEGSFEPVRSQWAQLPFLAEQALAAVGSGLAQTIGEVISLMSRSLYAAQHGQEAKNHIKGAIAAMLGAGMLVEESGNLRATLMGAVAVRFQLAPRSVMAMRRALDAVGEGATIADLLMMAVASDECDARLRALNDEAGNIFSDLANESMRLKDFDFEVWPHLLGQPSEKELLAAAKTTNALLAWVRLGVIDEAAENVRADPFEVEEARKETTRVLAALRAVYLAGKGLSEADGKMEARPDVAERLLAISAMVSAGLEARPASLTLVPGIGPRNARCLAAAGVGDIEALAQISVERLQQIPGLPGPRAEKWVDAAAELIRSGRVFRYVAGEFI